MPPGDPRTDDEVLAQLTAALETRLAGIEKDDYTLFLSAIQTLPRGLRAMAATYEFDVSMTLDDLGWHFANWHNWDLAEETSRGLKELETEEIADLFDRARELVRPYWDTIGALTAIDFEKFIDWYQDSALEQALNPLNDRLYDLLGASKYRLLAFWIGYAKRHPQWLS